MNFMIEKGTPFPNALLFKRHFHLVSVWRRALIAVSLLRHLLSVPANSHWYNYGYAAYKFAQAVFDAYCNTDPHIWKECSLYKSLSADVIAATSKSSPDGKK